MRMIDSLNAIYNRTDFRMHPYASAERLAIMEKEMAAAGGQISPKQQFGYAYELLKAGRSQEAARLFDQVIQSVPTLGEINEKTKGIYEILAIAHMRIGEQENCILNHSGESCLFPIQGKGVHTKQEGSRAAIEIYRRILEKFPTDSKSRYLLNLAYQTVGEYPQMVPQQWLIPPQAFQSAYPLPHFPNIALELGLDVNALAGGCIADDFDNDGFIDLIASSWGMKDQILFFKNNGDGTFSDQTGRAGLMGLTSGLNLAHADYNNDGFLDFLILRGAWKPLESYGVQPNSLMKNNGDGTFSDATFEAGIYTVRSTQTATWFDFDRDGWLDLFIGNEMLPSHNSFPSEFYHNNGDGTFTEMPESAGLKLTTFVKGVTSADFNNDGLDDLYVSVMNGNNMLFLNRGGSSWQNWRFEEVAAKAGVQEPWLSFPTWFFDYDNDGWEDIFVASFDSGTFLNQASGPDGSAANQKYTIDTPRLFHNNGNGTFTNSTTEAKLKVPLQAMGSNFGDLDNDGFPDIYIGTGEPDFRAIVPNKMFRNNAGQFFQDVTTAGGFGHIQKGHAIAFADFDNDGDQDIYAVMGGAFSGDVFQNAFFENPGSGNNWLTVSLEGSQSNRSAIGAKIRLTVKLPDGSTQTIYSRLSSGGSFGCSSLQQEIGIGKAVSVEKLEVRWPNKTNTFIDYGKVTPNQKVKIKEGDNRMQAFPMKSFVFKKTGAGHQHH
jgi:hypothetical protein